jgi:hypothetical protein
VKTTVRKRAAKTKASVKKAVVKKLESAGISVQRKKNSAARQARGTTRARAALNNRWVNFGWVLPLVLFAIGIAILIKPKTSYSINHVSARLITLFQENTSKTIGDRIAYWSEKLLNEPDLLAALGGDTPELNDTAPLFPHAYDCTTFVETVAALAKSNSTEEIADQLISIRYKNGKVSYATRNHFPEADWIPNNQVAGNLQDITIQISRKAGFVAAFANKDIDKVAWFKDQKNEHADRVLASSLENEGVVTVKLPYVPMNMALTALPHIPQGAVINIVRENKERYPVLISHQGLLIWKNGVAYFRHASRNRRIREVPFNEYLHTARKLPWKVLGFNVDTFTNGT